MRPEFAGLFRPTWLWAEREPRAKRIAEAGYDPAAEHLHITFRDGTTAEVSTRQ